MSLRAYAAHRGVALSTVQLAVKNGHIRRDRSGKVDSAKADSSWQPRTNGSHGRDEVGERFHTARAAKETLNAKLAELEYRQKSGELIEAKEVQRVAFERSRALRDLITAMPDRLGPVVAGFDDPVDCIRVIEEECRRVLEEMSRPIEFS